MAKGKKTGGRVAGTPNRATVEREAEAARAVAAAAAMENPKVQEAVAALGDPMLVEQAQRAGKRNGKSILDDFANVLAGMAAYYQPTPDGSNRNADEARFLKYAELAMFASDKVAQYQTPKLSAVMVGQTQVRTIQVEGGLPSLVRPSPPMIEGKAEADPPAKPETPAAVVPRPFSEAAE